MPAGQPRQRCVGSSRRVKDSSTAKLRGFLSAPGGARIVITPFLDEDTPQRLE
jgi:hypothetical protein